jgi:hypothetical protein
MEGTQALSPVVESTVCSDVSKESIHVVAVVCIN